MVILVPCNPLLKLISAMELLPPPPITTAYPLPEVLGKFDADTRIIAIPYEFVAVNPAKALARFVLKLNVQVIKPGLELKVELKGVENELNATDE